MELQAVTGQLYIINGAVQDPSRVPGLLVQSVPSRAARGRQDDFLFAHLTLSGPAEDSKELASDLLDSISDIFYQTPGSVTAALRKAIIETNKQLLGYNLKGSSRTYEGAITCAVLRGQELYMAQSGEAFAFIGHNFGIERLPAAAPARVTTMGRTAGLDIRYYHNWLQSGDMLLMTDPRLGHLSTEALKPALIDTDVAGSLEALTQALDKNSGRLLVVEFTDEAPTFLPDVDRPKPAARPVERVMEPPATQPMREGMTVSTATPVFRAPTVPSVNVDVETAEITARRATSQAASGLSRVTGWLARFLSKLKPPQPGPNDHSGWALPTIIAIVIPILVTVIVTSVFLQRGRVERFSEIKTGMSQNLNLAREAGNDVGLATAYYNQVLQLGVEADTLRPNDLEVERLRNEALAELDLLGGISRLNSTLLYEFTPETFLSAVAVGDELNGDIFVLDSVNGLVYRQKTDGEFEADPVEEPQAIVFNEQAIGNHIVGQVLDVMWRPKGQSVSRDGLAVLDGSGALITFFPNFAENRAIPLGLASSWVRPTQITSFDERLYVLDPGSETIWRYFPDGDNFILNDSQQAVTFNEDVDLDQVVDMAIYSVDGSVILLYADGRIRSYSNGRLEWDESELINSGMGTPFVAPTAIKIIGRGVTASIFVVDPGSGRIVQLSRLGNFLAQYKALDDVGGELFAKASDIAVLDTPLRVFVAAENKLFLASQE